MEWASRIAALLVVTCFASQANAAPGDGYGAGPVFALAKDGTFSLGWEAAATTQLPLLKASVGGTYALNADSQRPTVIHYIAFEPWLLIGGSIGAALIDVSRVGLMYGVWEGAPIALKGALVPDRDPPHPKSTWLLTLTVGCRVFGGGSAQFYFAPSCGTTTCTSGTADCAHASRRPRDRMLPDLLRQVLCVSAHAHETARAPGVHPGQT
jgi:hypothetical protein